MAFQPENKDDDTNPFECPIGQELMTNPVVLPCGHTFEEKNIRQWVTGKPNPKCPTCRRPTSLNAWSPNFALIEAYKYHKMQIAVLKAPPRSRRASAPHPHFRSSHPSFFAPAHFGPAIPMAAPPAAAAAAAPLPIPQGAGFPPIINIYAFDDADII